MNNIETIQGYKKPIIVAEIGCNHMGDLEIAKNLINLAKDCGADYAKFQKRTPAELLTEEQYGTPHPAPHNSYGTTYGEHREFLEFSIDEHSVLKQYCSEVGIKYATSVWDVTSAREIGSISPDYIKIPSACNNHQELLKVLRDEYEGDVHVSFGMSTNEEIENLISFYEANNSAHRLVIYACTSGYPVPFKDIHLLEISRLNELYGNRVQQVGFSGHHLGIAIDVAAYALGANWIERHFTKDRTWKGTDHAASLEPAGLSKLVRDLNATHSAVTYKPSEIIEIEKAQREKLKYRPR